MATMDRQAWDVRLLEAGDCLADLFDRLLRAVCAVVLGVALLWAGVEFVVGVARLAATGCAGSF